MAKETNYNEIVQTLQEAQKNKEHLSALASSVERYVAQQKKGLEELESIILQAREGKLAVKKEVDTGAEKIKTPAENQILTVNQNHIYFSNAT